MAGVTDVVTTVADSAGAITNLQNTDNTQKQNMNVTEEHENWLDTIKAEFDEGKITETSIRTMCARQDPPVDPTPILEYVHMTNLDRQMSPYFKTDLRDVPTQGYDYNGTLGDGDSVTVAGCTITATKYEGEDVYDTDDVFGMEVEKAHKVRAELLDRGTGDYLAELFFHATDTDDFDDIEDYAPSERTLYHCHSDYLGDFDYDPTMYRIGYKEIEEKDGSKSQLPVLEYIGPSDVENTWVCSLDSNDTYERQASSIHAPAIDDAEDVVDNMVPKGCKVLDYTFCTTTGRQLNFVPRVQEGVVSMNYTFAGTSMNVFPDMDLADRIGNKDESAKIYLLPSTLQCAQGTFMDNKEIHGNFYMRNPLFEGAEPESSAMQSAIGFFNGNWTGIHYTKETNNKDAYLEQLSKDCVNSIDMFSGCDGLDKKYTDGTTYDAQILFWNVNFHDGRNKNITYDKVNMGGELTPYLTEEMSRGMYDDIADSTAMLRGEDAVDGYFKNRGDVEFLINNDGSLNTKFDISGLDQDKLNEARANQIILADGKADSGHVDTSVEVAKDGWITNNKVKEKDGSMTYDATGLKVSYQDYLDDTSAWWEKFAQAGAIGLAAGLVTKGVSDNKWLGLAAGIGGGFIASKFVPNTLYPVVHGVATFFHSEKLEELANKLPGAEAYKKNKEIKAFNDSLPEYNAQWDNNYNVGRELYDKRISKMFEEATTQGKISMLVDKNIALAMENNGSAAAKELDFAGVASLGEGNAKCVVDLMEEAVKTSSDAFTNKFGDGKDLTEENKQEMRDYYLYLMQSIDSYNKGALNGIASVSDSEQLTAVQTDGLAMVNRAYVGTAMDSLKEMNEKYQFMDEATWTKFAELNVEGVNMANLQNYQNSESYFAEAREYAAGKTVYDIKALAEVDDKFKSSMGAELETIDQRIPEGWTIKPEDEFKAPETEGEGAETPEGGEGTSATNEQPAAEGTATTENPAGSETPVTPSPEAESDGGAPAENPDGKERSETEPVKPDDKTPTDRNTESEGSKYASDVDNAFGDIKEEEEKKTDFTEDTVD